jgi:Flp pilus assembly CpaE family ATPase
VSQELVSLGIRALLVEDNRVDALLIRDAVAKSEETRIRLDHVLSLGEAVVRLQQEHYDVILLDLMLPDSIGLDTIVRTHEGAPGVPIVVLTGIDDETMAIRAVQSGAQDYLIKGQLNAKQVVRAIRYAVIRHDALAAAAPPPAPGELGRLVALCGGKGGVGTTTIACHLAVELKACSEKRVLLLDLDPCYGMAGFVMKAESEYSAADVLQNIRRLDASFWESVVVTGKHRIDILPAPRWSASEQSTFSIDNLRPFFAFLRRMYDWVVIDLGSWRPYQGLNGRDFDNLFVVTTPDVMSLYRTKQIVGALSESGFEGDRLGLVLNGVVMHTEVGPEDIESLLGIRVYVSVPHDPEVSEALAAGKTMAKNTDFTKCVEIFACRLAGIEPTGPKERKSSLFGSLRFGLMKPRNVAG